MGAEAGDCAVDETRGVELLPAQFRRQAELVDDGDIRLREQASRGLDVSLGRPVEHDSALAPIEGSEEW